MPALSDRNARSWPFCFVRRAFQLSGEYLVFDNVPLDSTVLHLKQMIQERVFVPVVGQKLVYAGRAMEDAETLAENHVWEYAMYIMLIVRPLPGCKQPLGWHLRRWAPPPPMPPPPQLLAKFTLDFQTLDGRTRAIEVPEYVGISPPTGTRMLSATRALPLQGTAATKRAKQLLNIARHSFAGMRASPSSSRSTSSDPSKKGDLASRSACVRLHPPPACACPPAPPDVQCGAARIPATPVLLAAGPSDRPDPQRS